MKLIRSSFLALAIAVMASGCMIKSYPSANIKESLARLCEQEYGITGIDVKVVENTIGVYLPLEKLFAADFKEAAVTGKVRNLETLFEPSPEALEKVEDVLFGISRVLLSTDKEFDFYVLQATDVKKTGLQLVLSGYVNDIRRVRIWDIARSEYRKRVVHELRMNRAVKWHQPVRSFLQDIEQRDVYDIRSLYFSDILPVEAIQTIFLGKLYDGTPEGKKYRWEVLDMRSTPLQKNEVLVYVKMIPVDPSQPFDPKFVSDEETLQYLFTLSFNEETALVRRIIPFQYQDEQGLLKRIPFPKELNIEENLDKWEQEFSLTPIRLGPFLADQLTRRTQALLATDERIQNTFRNVQLQFTYAADPEPAHFGLNIEANLADFNNYPKDSIVLHEDMLYLLQLASREFVDLLRSYAFEDFAHLRLKVDQELTPLILGRDNLELFRKKKLDLQGLLAVRQF